MAAGFARGQPKMAMARATVRLASASQRKRSAPVRPLAGDGEAGGTALMTGGDGTATGADSAVTGGSGEGGVEAGSGGTGVRMAGRTIGCGVPREAAVGPRASRVSACRWPADGGLG